MVSMVELESTWSKNRGILSPLRLPITPHRHYMELQEEFESPTTELQVRHSAN